MAGGICAVYGCNNYHVKNSSKSFFSFPRDITRESTSEMAISSKELREEVLSLLECTVCLNYMCGPVIQCENGHNICYECKFQFAKCPSCDALFSKIRNRALEHLAHRVKIACPNQKAGCEEEILVSNIKKHEKECPFRMFSCKCCCEWEGRRSELFKHFENSHPEKLIKKSEVTLLNISSEDHHYVHLVLAYNELFWLSVFRSGLNVGVRLLYIGDKKNITKFLYKVKFISGDGENVVSFRSEPKPDFDSDDHLFYKMYPHVGDYCIGYFLNENPECIINIKQSVSNT